MKIGITLPARDASGRAVSPGAIAEVAARANALGYHSIWANDHILMPSQFESRHPYSSGATWETPRNADWLDPLITLAWAGAAAPDLELGTAVIVLPLRHPMLLAKQVATLDLLTSGRVVLGVGVGWLREESVALGVNFEERWPRTEEMVSLMRRLWTADDVEFSGSFFSANGLTARPRPTRQPPILWAGKTVAALRRVVALGDGWYPLGLSEDEFLECQQKLQSLCAEQRRDSRSLRICVGIGPSARLSADLMRWYVERGVDDLVCTPPRADWSAMLCELERIAHDCRLQTRA